MSGTSTRTRRRTRPTTWDGDPMFALRLLALRDVLNRPDHPERSSIRADAQSGLPEQHAFRPIRSDDAVLARRQIVVAASREGCLQVGADAGGVLFFHELHR